MLLLVTGCAAWAHCLVQDELDMTKETFRERFSDDPRKDDLTILAPKQDDPTEQVGMHSTCS